ncbi:Chloride channel protein CLC-f [Dendrobium catenatum]|uniref:Chloride channel protein CLC-f n=1 Tax=Dendrobium catenatum TaxID=906689 RepID=A0A2I0WX56_9ASPA|nr:Chloride channel protein CLC-f [Dendrobium catenatum]
MQINTCQISSCFTRGFQHRGVERGILTCFPDTDLTIAKELMEAKGIKQLPVVARCRETINYGKRRLVGLLNYDAIERCLRSCINAILLCKKEYTNDNHMQNENNSSEMKLLTS